MNAAPLSPEASKRLATARAQIALGGLQLRSVAAGGWWVFRHDFATYCRELVDLEHLAADVAGVRQ